MDYRINKEQISHEISIKDNLKERTKFSPVNKFVAGSIEGYLC